MASRSRTWLSIYAKALSKLSQRNGGQQTPPKRILVPHHLLLGDTIMLAATLAKLRERYPAAEIVHVMPCTFTTLFTGSPWGVRSVGWNVRDPASASALWQLGSFDVAYVIGDNRFSWLAQAIGARRIVAFDGDRPSYKSWPVTDALAMPAEPMAWSDLAATIVPGPPARPIARGQWPVPACQPYDRPTGPYAVLHVGASSMHKTWLPERWAGVAAGLAARGVTPCWSAGPREEALVTAIPGAGLHKSYAGQLDLPQLWNLVANATLVVTGDTSVAHIGRANLTPTVVLYGPSGPLLGGPGRFWANCPGAGVAIDPFPCRDQNLLFKREVPWVQRCSRGPAECPAPRCMHALSVDAVLAAASPFL